MNTVYVAASLANAAHARDLAADLEINGFRVVSSWHDKPDATVEAETRLTGDAMAAIATQCRREIASADVLVCLYGPPSRRCGHVIEAEHAATLGKRVILAPIDDTAHLPSILLLVPPYEHVASPAAVLRVLGRAAA